LLLLKLVQNTDCRINYLSIAGSLDYTNPALPISQIMIKISLCYQVFFIPM
jgi:hypothetical protein